jgi:ribosomal-protein-alanine N-acetyltransferase
METRLASREDAAIFAELHEASFGAARWTESQFAGSLALDTALALVAFEGGRAQGFILCQIVGDEAEILTFCVHPAARGRGIGTDLLNAVLAAAKQQKAHRIFLEVAVDNAAALALYNKTGFRITGKRHRYYKREGHPVDAVLMEAEL